VIIVPVMFLLLAVAIDLGRLFYAYVAVDNAAKEGALFGSRNPLCDNSANSSCGDPNNVVWHVQNEAPNIGSGFTTAVACRDSNTGALIQPINNCVDGNKYQVTVTYPFQLITPVLSSMLGNSLTLHAESQATVISDAFDPAGLEVLVWVSTTGSDNGAAITAACTPADSASSPGFYYQPCQDATNSDNYLSFQENATISYKIRVRNTGNIDLSGITYGFAVGGTSIATPGTCGTLPTSINRGTAPSYCTFTRTAAFSGTGDFPVTVTAQGNAAGLSTGQTSGAGVVHVVPAPRLRITLFGSPYQLGGTGNGVAGVPSYGTGNLALSQDTASSLAEIRNPTGWFYLIVANQGGAAANFTADVTQNGASVLPAQCPVPTSLAAAGQSGDSFVCIFPRTFTGTQAYTMAATANATNAIIVAGTQKSLTATTTNGCNGGRKVVPNLVDTLTPSANETFKTVGQSRATWTSAGFTGTVTTNPAGATNAYTTLTQSVLAYTCQQPSSTVTIGAQP